MTLLVIGAVTACVGLGWWLLAERVRHGPENLERGTQHLVLSGLPGCWVFFAGAALIVSGLVKLWASR